MERRSARVSSWAVEGLSAKAVLLAACTWVAGCGVIGLGEGPFGPPLPSKLLEPFAGNWSFDIDRTAEAWKAAGASDADVAALRQQHQASKVFALVHPDISIQGNEAVGAGMLSTEYRFYAMHPHDGKICGKAWFHEDRYDPGDMSKCLVRLSRDGDLLRLEVRESEASADPDDPEVENVPPPDSGAAAGCETLKADDRSWSPWEIFVFRKK